MSGKLEAAARKRRQSFHITTRPSRSPRPNPGFPVLVLQPIVVEKEGLALDACNGSTGCGNSSCAVPRPYQIIIMISFLEYMHRPPLGSWHHSHT